MTYETYSRQQARADKRSIFQALCSLKQGDTGPADRLTRRAFLATAATATLAPALPGLAPAAPLNVTVTSMGAVYAEGIPNFFMFRGGRIVPLGGESARANAKHIDALTAALKKGDHFPNRAGQIARMKLMEKQNG